MSIFRLPKTIFSAGALARLPDELQALGLGRPLVVTDKGLISAGVVQRVTDTLGDAMAVTLYDGVIENPVFANVADGVALYRKGACDCVIALGGGSVIDTAKFVSIVVTNGGSVEAYLGPLAKLPSPVAPLIVIPTTAGTGSEASPDAGIHPDSKSASVGATSLEIVPMLAVLDPELTVSLPKRLTAATGVDALSHCIEGYLSTTDSPFADILALDGIARSTRYLSRAVADGRDLDARAHMMAAAYAGGAAIAKGLGPAHALAIACGDQGLHHGMLSGIGLIATFDLVRPHAEKKAQAIATAMGLNQGADIVPSLIRLCEDAGLPASLNEAGYRAADIGALGEAAANSHFNQTSPYKPTADEFAGVMSVSLRI